MKKKTSQFTRKHKQAKHKQAIIMLNLVATCKISPSEVHGVGLFALKNLRKGDTLYADSMPEMLDLPYTKFKELRPEVAELILGHFPTVVGGSHFLYPDTLLQCYMNHSSEPNYDNKTGKMLKGVKQGKEIFEDYKKIEGYEKVFLWLKE